MERIWPFAVAALATSYLVQAWRQSLLFADWRARAELWSGKLGDLAGCAFCAMPWIGGACLTIMLLPVPERSELTLTYATYETVCVAICVAGAAFLGNIVAADELSTAATVAHVLGAALCVGLGIFAAVNHFDCVTAVWRVVLMFLQFIVTVLGVARAAYYLYERSKDLNPNNTIEIHDDADQPNP